MITQGFNNNSGSDSHAGSGMQTVFVDLAIDPQGLLSYHQRSQQLLLFLEQQPQLSAFQRLNITNNNTSIRRSSCYFAENEEIENAEPQTQADVAESNASTSTVEDADILASEDLYPHLTGLNSGNLMQFSQQSALQELLMKENVNIDAKPNLDVLPTREEHDLGGFKFQLDVQPPHTGKSGWTYSSTLNKVYIRMNDVLNIEAVHTPRKPFQQMRLRVMLCFMKEASEPVLRCQNHISKDTESVTTKRYSFLRCENPHAEYCGSAEGKNINDRLAVVLPLSVGVKPKQDHSVRHSVELKFACQNSCTGRKETYLIFLLESMSGEIHAQRLLNIKICSCPKRDRDIDEGKQEPKKRKHSNANTADSSTFAVKVQRRDAGLLKSANSSELDEHIGGSNDTNHPKTYRVQRTDSGEFHIVTRSRELALYALKGVQDGLAHRLAKSGDSRDAREYRRGQRLYDYTQHL